MCKCSYYLSGGNAMSQQNQKIMDEGASIFFCRIKTIRLYYQQLSGEWKNAISQYMNKENNIIPQQQCTAVLRYCLAFAFFMQKQNIFGIKTVAYSHLEDFIECTACISGKKEASVCLWSDSSWDIWREKVSALVVLNYTSIFIFKTAPF